jgi:hypothetical protein
MSLAKLAKVALPLNRKERYFTGTVFPAIVARDGFKDLSLLATLMGCELPSIDPDPRSTNIQFFTEYSFVESVFDPNCKARFPDPPETKDTPDIMISVWGERRILLALEAKMYHRPSVMALQTQMNAQREQLDYLQEKLRIDEVHHGTLLPGAFAQKLNLSVSALPWAGFSIVLWDDLLQAYKRDKGEGDYWLGMLELALEHWDELASMPAAYGTNADGKLTGYKIVMAFPSQPSLLIMGRQGGLSGAKLANDIETGGWRSQLYEVSIGPEAPNTNWFYIEEFLELLRPENA